MEDSSNSFGDIGVDAQVERPTIDSAAFTSIDAKQAKTDPHDQAEAALDLLEESEDITSYSSYVTKPSSTRYEAEDLQVPNQRWELFWEETSSKIHSEEVCGTKVNPKLDIVVSNPELVSSLMSKLVVC